MSTKQVFENARARFMAELAEIQKRAQGLKSKIELLDELAVDKNLTEDEPPAAAAHSERGKPRAEPELEKAPEGLTQACLWAINSLAKNQSLSPAAVGQFIVDHGFVPSGVNFKAVVMNTLKRQASYGKIKQEKRGRNLFFSPL